MVVNLTKSTSTLSVLNKGGRKTWADSSVKWADSLYRWATDGLIPTDVQKSSSTINMITKS